jgi:hypothetical protein
MRGRHDVLVVQLPVRTVEPGVCDMESAFAAHLRELRERLGARFDRLVLVAPAMSAAQHAAQAAQLARVRETADGVRFVSAYPAEVSRPGFWSGHLLRVWRLLRGLMPEAGLVHSGLSTSLGHPLMFMACLAGKRAGVPLVFMVDIDFRQHSWRFRDPAEASGAVALARWPDPDAVADQLPDRAADRARLARMARDGVAFARANTQGAWLERRIAWTLEQAGSAAA